MPERLNQIQGIRTLAMLGIFVTHTSLWLSDDLGWFTPIVGQLGGFGVVTFFVLSGFLLAHKNTIIPKLTKTEGIKAAWHKASKMYALYFVTFVIAFIAKFPDNSYDWLKAAISLPFNLTLTQAFVPSPSIINSFNGPAWFLSAFFGIWLLVYMFPGFINKLQSLSKRRCVQAILLLLLIQSGWLLVAEYGILPLLRRQYYLHNCYGWLVYNNPILCLSEFCCGILIGRLCRVKTCSLQVQNILALIALALTMCYMLSLVHSVSIQIPWIVIIECLVSMGLVSSLSSDSIAGKVLSSRVLVWFGNLTGYFFLIHGAINFSLRTFFLPYISNPYPWMFFVSFAISLALSICAEWLYNVRKISVPIAK